MKIVANKDENFCIEYHDIYLRNFGLTTTGSPPMKLDLTLIWFLCRSATLNSIK